MGRGLLEGLRGWGSSESGNRRRRRSGGIRNGSVGIMGGSGD